ncbi:MAG: hypothetical protein JWM87_733 [Candidatus Eremiobacteraeota bacterium]|nr:hypothetical protein [Candidatus Eremiobacteraeota bacterium]
MIRKIYLVLATALLALTPLAFAPSVALADPSNSTQFAFSVSGNGVAATLPLNGHQTCITTITNIGGGAKIALTTSADGFAFNAPTAGATVANATGTYVTSVSSQMAIAATVSGYVSGSVAGSIHCSSDPYVAPRDFSASVPSGAANTIVKNAPGAIVSVLITVAGTGTGNVLCYDNATTNSGTVVAVFAATIAVGPLSLPLPKMPLANGLTCVNVASGPVFTVSYQ